MSLTAEQASTAPTDNKAGPGTQTVTLSLLGRASDICVHLSQPEVRFGDCESGAKSDVAVTLSNSHKSIAVSYEVEKVAQY